MQNYKVTGSVAIFGVGMVLKLTKSQAETRTSSLKKKSKDHYVVLASVQFKKNEEKAQNDDNKTPKKNQKTTSDDDKDSGDQKIQDQIITDGNDINNLPNV
jgi:homoserine dehydrogenase